MAYQGTSPATTGSLSQLLYKEYKKVFFDEYPRVPTLWSKYAKVHTMDGKYHKEGSMVGFGAHTTRREGQAPNFDVMIQGPDKEITITGYGMAFAVTREGLKDDRQGHLKKAPAELAKSAQYTLETLFWDHLNSGFVTTKRTGRDSAAMFTATHSTIAGGSQSNLATSSVINETSWEAMLLHFRKMKNEKGIPIMGAFTPWKLIIPPEMEFRVRRFLESDKRPGTMDNDKNVHMNSITYEIVPWLSSTTAWFVLCQNHDLGLWWRDNIAYEAYDDKKTKSSIHDSTFRLGIEFMDWRGVYGNAGA